MISISIADGMPAGSPAMGCGGTPVPNAGMDMSDLNNVVGCLSFFHILVESFKRFGALFVLVVCCCCSSVLRPKQRVGSSVCPGVGVLSAVCVGRRSKSSLTPSTTSTGT